MLCGGSGVGAKSQVGGVGSKWADPTAGGRSLLRDGRQLADPRYTTVAHEDVSYQRDGANSRAR